MKTPGVYILQSLQNGRYYIGSTDDIQRRLETHNNCWVKATAQTRPFTLKIFLECSNLSEARTAELRLKGYKRRDITEKVIQDKTFPLNYAGT